MKRILIFIALFSVSVLSAQAPSIPILNLQDYTHEETKEGFLNAFEHAVKNVGYFLITGISLDEFSIDKVYLEAKNFFASTDKKQYTSPNGHRGYIPGESAKGENRVDYKECYHVGRELTESDFERLQYEYNVWPKNRTDFQDAMQTLYYRIDLFKNVLGEAFSELLDQKKAFLREMVQEGDSLMRVVRYPANPPEGSTWAGSHTDINLFALYPRASSHGLQVQTKQGEWLDVNVPSGMVFVHCGDMLENLSNGLCKATIHRVEDNGLNEDRYAIVFFVHPRADDRLDPLPSCIEKTGGVRRYANLSRIELLAERLIDLGLANQELMEVFVRSGAIEKLKQVGRFSSKAETALINEGFIQKEPNDSKL